MQVDQIGHLKATQKLKARKHVLKNAMNDLDVPITFGLMTKAVELKPVAANRYLIRTKKQLVPLFAKKVFVVFLQFEMNLTNLSINI